MTPKRISAADKRPTRIVIVTLDNHLAGAVDRARAVLSRESPNLRLSFHAATDWDSDAGALERCKADIAQGDIIIATMLFMEDHIRPVLPALQARRADCAAMIGCMSASEIVKLTRIGRFSMDGSQRGPLDFLKKLRGSSKSPSHETGGARQMAMLRRLPKILRFIPGTAQDVRAYFLTLQYWLAGSQDNVVNMARFLARRYVDANVVNAAAPKDYPDVGLYHPRLKQRIASSASELPKPAPCNGTVGLLVMRSYVLAGNTAHYDAVIAGLEARGLAVLPAFASGLDARPAIDAFFRANGKTAIDALLSLTGFSLVGGPAYNDARAAEETLAGLDVPYVTAQALEFQTLEQWRASDRGLMPVEATMMVAIPELDGAIAPTVFGGRSSQAAGDRARDMTPDIERVDALAGRIAKLVALRRRKAGERKTAIVLFNFPPNAGATGTAAFLSVFESLHNTLKALRAEGQNVEIPATVDELRDRILKGNAERFGAPANVHARIRADDHVRREKYLREIETQWGPAPGRHQSDGSSIFVLGERFGDVFVGIQPGFGYEGDPMRLLFEKGFAPTHAFSAFYRWLREDFKADAVLHFGTHGALEFMPGKQTGLSSSCWPERLIGDLPNIYLYAANNPSEGMIAKRRGAATLVSYLTPPLAQAGLYRGLLDLKASVERWRNLAPDAPKSERAQIASVVQAQAASVDLAIAEPAWLATECEEKIAALVNAILELEYTLIPNGLHVVGAPPEAQERRELIGAIAEAAESAANDDKPDLATLDALLAKDHETPALARALSGRFIRPVAGGDVLRTPAILPTGRNLHGFDPFRIPSSYAAKDGARQADILLARHQRDGHTFPETIALVLWGTDNLKSEGGPIAQALALIGARPRFDGYGRLCGACLIPLEELGRPRVDVVVTLSGIFRDLLPLQTKLLAQAAFLAASADEPLDRNFVRAHALAHQAQHGGDLESAALRVFSNAEGVYGSNVNHLIDAGCWTNENELGDAFARRKCFAYGRDGKTTQQPILLRQALGRADLAYQNLESVELGVTTVDHYFDSLGGINRLITQTRGQAAPVYISDQTRGDGKVRSLGEQVALETRTRMLNPKWYEGLLKHGYEGVRHIEAHVTNTMGWSATTGQVAPWVYEQMTRTFMLDPEMRKRLADLNPAASAKVANRLLEAHNRGYWQPDDSLLSALTQAGEEFEDRLEGVATEAAA